MTTYVADCSFDHIPGANLKAAGIVGVCRYTMIGSSGKNLTETEFDELEAAGIVVCLNYERGNNDIASGYAGGQAAARQALSLSWYPQNRAIYFSVDEAATWAEAEPYFQGIRSVTGAPGRSRPYGGADIINGAVQAGIADGGWLTNATSWSMGQTSPYLCVTQLTTHPIGIPGVANSDWDCDVVNRADWCLLDDYGAPTAPPTACIQTNLKKGSSRKMLFQLGNAVYFTDGLYYRWVPTPDALKGLQVFLCIQGVDKNIVAVESDFISSGGAGLPLPGAALPPA